MCRFFYIRIILLFMYKNTNTCQDFSLNNKTLDLYFKPNSLPSKNGERAYLEKVRDNIAKADGLSTTQLVHANKNAGKPPNASNIIGNSPPDLGIMVPTSA